MRIREISKCTVTFPRKKSERQERIWNLGKNKVLKSAIEKCLATGEEVFDANDHGILYHILPRFPYTEEAMAKYSDCAHLLKVSVTAYHVSAGLGVESGEQKGNR